jgi:hypothetical protein
MKLLKNKNRSLSERLRDKIAVTNHNSSILSIKVLVFVSFIFYSSSTVVIYALKGIPLFRDSRLASFAGSGGLGIIERISNASLPILLFSGIALLYLIYRRLGSIKLDKRNIITLIFLFAVLFFVLLSMILSGSKSSFLEICTISFVFIYAYAWHSRSKPMNFMGGKIGVIVIVFAFITSLLIISVQGRGLSEEEEVPRGIMALLFRFAAYGDIYVNAYIFDTISELRGTNPFVGLFGGFLSTFRLFPVDQVYVPIGIQFTNILIPGLDMAVGPNPRHNVLGLHYFGFYFSPFYSFILGIGLACIRNYLLKPRIIDRDFDLSTVAMVMALNLLPIDTDFEFSLSLVAGLLISGTLIIFCSRLIYGVLVNVERGGEIPSTFKVPLLSKARLYE